MKYNLLLIANKAGVALAMHSQEYNSYEAAEEAVGNLRKGLAEEAGYSLRFFITPKGEQDA